MAAETFKSVIEGTSWPALVGKAGAALLAMQYQLEQSQWWPSEKLKAAQFRQLQGLLRHAEASVPFYRKRFAENGIDANAPLDDAVWARIPLLTRSDIQDAGNGLLSTAIPKSHGRHHSISTSGSTGMPVTVHGTALTDFFWRCFTLREYFWHGLNTGKKLAGIRYAKGTEGGYPNGTEYDGWGGSVDPIFVTGPSALLSVMTPVPQQVEWLQRQKPDYLLTYPSNLAALLDYCCENKLRFRALQSVETMGEVLNPETREACRETWGVEVVDMYSTQEVGYAALQCPRHQHYHVQSENLMLEVLAQHDRPCAPGETGRVILTALHNFATPLIRYDVGDYAVVGEPCPCGRGLPVLMRIMGRARNMMTLPSGGQLWPNFGDYKLSTVAPLKQFQLVQKSLSELELRVVARRPFTSEDEDRIRAVIAGEVGDVFKITFTYHDEIARGAGGKYEDFRSEVPR